MSKAPKKIEPDVASITRALLKTMDPIQAMKYPMWMEDVKAGRTLLSFDEWRKTEERRNTTFGYANHKGFNCDRSFVEKLLKGDDLMELVNNDGVRVFVPRGDMNEVMHLLNRGVDAMYGAEEE